MTDFETLWQEISTAALLGTRRKPFRLKDPGGAGAGEAAALLKTGGDGEHLLLQSAAVAVIYR